MHSMLSRLKLNMGGGGQSISKTGHTPQSTGLPPRSRHEKHTRGKYVEKVLAMRKDEVSSKVRTINHIKYTCMYIYTIELNRLTKYGL